MEEPRKQNNQEGSLPGPWPQGLPCTDRHLGEGLRSSQDQSLPPPFLYVPPPLLSEPTPFPCFSSPRCRGEGVALSDLLTNLHRGQEACPAASRTERAHGRRWKQGGTRRSWPLWCLPLWCSAPGGPAGGASGRSCGCQDLRGGGCSWPEWAEGRCSTPHGAQDGPTESDLAPMSAVVGERPGLQT